MHVSIINSAVLAIYVLSELPNFVSSCESTILRERFMGFGCSEDNQIKFTGVAEHECVLRCVLDKYCTAVNYDAQEKSCSRFEKPCPVFGIYEHMHYQILALAPKDGCVKWVATHDWDYPRIVKKSERPNGQARRLARLRKAGEILPAKWPDNNFNAFTAQYNSVIYDNEFEVLVVNEACSLLWVNYDASSGSPMPPRGILGGHLADGTPLYVAAVNVPGTIAYVVGYYNDIRRIGTCNYFGVTEAQRMDILTAP